MVRNGIVDNSVCLADYRYCHPNRGETAGGREHATWKVVDSIRLVLQPDQGRTPPGPHTRQLLDEDAPGRQYLENRRRVST